MSDSGGYNYGNDYSYGYDYSSNSQNANNIYEYNNYPSTLKNPTYVSPYSQTSQQQPYNPAAILNNPAAQIGMQFGTQALSAGQEYVNNNVIFFKFLRLQFFLIFRFIGGFQWLFFENISMSQTLMFFRNLFRFFSLSLKKYAYKITTYLYLII